MAVWSSRMASSAPFSSASSLARAELI
jgi:hypothetical protein